MNIRQLVLVSLLAAVGLGASPAGPNKGEVVYLPFGATFQLDYLAFTLGRVASPAEKSLCDEYGRCMVPISPCQKLKLIKQTGRKTIATRPRWVVGLVWPGDLRRHTHTTWKACFDDQIALEAARDRIPVKVAADAILIGRIEAFLSGPGADYASFSPLENELLIPTPVWDRLPSFSRPLLAEGLAIMCERAGYDRRVRIRDGATGSYLARFGRYGFEERPTTPTR